MPNRRPIIDLRRDLKFFAIVLGAILLIMLLGIIFNAPSLVPTGHWLVGVCLLNKTYIITVNINTTLYTINTTPSNCTTTPGLPVTGPAVVQLTCEAPLERVVFTTSGGVVAYNETMIGNCPS
jgi:hypothetical protein